MNILTENHYLLNPHELDLYIRLINQNSSYFYEDYMEHN